MQTLAVQEEAKTHIVRKGEIISKIAKRYECTPEDIISWNHLRSAKLKPGQKLTVYICSEKSCSCSSNHKNKFRSF